MSDDVIKISETEEIVITKSVNVPVVEIETVIITETSETEKIVVNGGDSLSVIDTGSKGDKGDIGIGVPAGGTTGQRLVKVSDTDYNTKWETQPPAPPSGADKQLQFNDGGVQGVDQNIRWNKNTKTLEIGVAPDEIFPHNPIAAVGFVDDYYQLIVHNEFEGASASSDFVATADNGNDDNFYVDLGINSSIYNVPEYTAYKANDGYLYCVGGNLVLNAETTGKKVSIAVGGSLEENIVANFTETGLELKEHYQITNRPEILSGTGEPPSATGLIDGTLFIKYTE